MEKKEENVRELNPDEMEKVFGGFTERPQDALDHGHEIDLLGPDDGKRPRIP